MIGKDDTAKEAVASLHGLRVPASAPGRGGRSRAGSSVASQSDRALRQVDVIPSGMDPDPCPDQCPCPDPCPWLADLIPVDDVYGPALTDEEVIARMPPDPFGPDWVPEEPDDVLFGLFGAPAYGPEAEAVAYRDDPEGRIDVIVRDLQDVDRLLAALQARRVSLLAQADEWAEIMVDVSVPAGGSEAGGSEMGGSESRRREMSHRSVVAEISCALRVPQQTVAAEIGTAVVLAGLPATMTSLGEGRISYRHAVAVADTCVSVPADGRHALETELLPVAESSTVARLKRKARDLRERLHPQPIVDRTRAAMAERRLGLEPALDGMGWLHHYLPIAAAVGIYESVHHIATGLRGTSEPRTMDQLRSDVLTDLIDEGIDTFVRSSATDHADQVETDDSTKKSNKNDKRSNKDDMGSGKARSNRSRRIGAVRPSVYLTIPALTAMGLSGEPAVLEGYGPIDPVTARKLAAEAPSFYRVLTDPVTGTVLDIDRNRYRPPADMRRWLRTRDQTCRFPFCGRRAGHSDIDHTVAWQQGGKTRAGNLAHFCGGDHTLKHETGWQVTQSDGGVLHWTSPSGRRYTTRPETPMRRQALRDAVAKLASDDAHAGKPVAATESHPDDDSPAPF